MKKVIILSILISLSLVFTGCGKKEQAKTVNSGNQEKSGLVVKENNTLMGWLKRSLAVECSIESPEGKIKMMAKEGSVRIEGIPFFSPSSVGEAPQAENGVMLSTKEWTYLWDKKTKQGTKMNNQEMVKLTGEEVNEKKDQESWEDMVKAWEAAQVKYSCQEKGIESSLLEEPVGIEFVDLTEAMNEMADFGKKLEAQLENGEEPDMSALEEIGKQLEKQGIGEFEL